MTWRNALLICQFEGHGIEKAMIVDWFIWDAAIRQISTTHKKQPTRSGFQRIDLSRKFSCAYTRTEYVPNTTQHCASKLMEYNNHTIILSFVCSKYLGDYTTTFQAWSWHAVFTSFTDSGGEFDRMGPMEEKPLFQVPQDYPLHITLPDCRLASLQIFQQHHLLYLFRAKYSFVRKFSF
jgi:hypothetical protein